jgi:hypothetical protein
VNLNPKHELWVVGMLLSVPSRLDHLSLKLVPRIAASRVAFLHKQKKEENLFFVGILKATEEKDKIRIRNPVVRIRG